MSATENMNPNPPMIAAAHFSARLWGGICAVGLATSWLLPNHYQPWLSFHSEAWIGIWGLVLALWVLLCLPKVQSWPLAAVACLALCAVPWVQYAFGILVESGQAWVSTVYLLSLGISLMVGWQMQIHRQYLLMNILMGGVVIGSVLSVSIQVVQWLQLYSNQPGSWFSLLIFPIKDTARPMSNLAQPNMLATLLVTGMVGLLWLYQQTLIKRWSVFVGLVFLCFGLALTQSRIGMIELAGIAFVSWHFRALWRDRTMAWWLPAILLLRGLFFLLLPTLAAWLDLETSWRGIEQISQNSDRWIIWVASIELLSMNPWWGQGWRSLLTPLMSTSAQGYLGQTHSIVLDILLWVGVPLGILLIGACTVLIVGIYRRINTIEQALALMVLLVILAHALVELPHHHLHFLIVPAMTLGSLLAMQRLSISHMPTGRWARLFSLPWIQVHWSSLMLSVAWVMAALSAHYIIKDYFRVEAHMWQIRLEDNNGLPITEHEIRPMFALNHLQSMLEFLPKQAHNRYSARDLEWMERSVNGETSPSSHFSLMASMALAGHMDRARYLMWTLNKSVPEREAKFYRVQWQNLQQQYPQLAELKWPEKGQALVKPQGGEKPFKAPKVP
jgi:O-Antigen ligase/Protein glycosylation ligase/Virulence factor membrane-bound polymerase, C-terminal